MAQPTIVGLGLTTLDVLIRAEQLPTWGQPTSVESFALDGGGMVGTAMVAAAKLGAKVGYIGVRGTDVVAELKMRFLTEVGVDVSRMITLPGPEREVIIVHVDADSGERMFCSLAGSRDPLYPPTLLDRDYITGADYLLLDGFHIDAALQAADWMHQGRQDCGDGRQQDRRQTPDASRRAGRTRRYPHLRLGLCPGLDGDQRRRQSLPRRARSRPTAGRSDPRRGGAAIQSATTCAFTRPPLMSMSSIPPAPAMSFTAHISSAYSAAGPQTRSPSSPPPFRR